MIEEIIKKLNGFKNGEYSNITSKKYYKTTDDSGRPLRGNRMSKVVLANQKIGNSNLKNGKLMEKYNIERIISNGCIDNKFLGYLAYEFKKNPKQYLYKSNVLLYQCIMYDFFQKDFSVKKINNNGHTFFEITFDNKYVFVSKASCFGYYSRNEDNYTSKTTESIIKPQNNEWKEKLRIIMEEFNFLKLNIKY